MTTKLPRYRSDSQILSDEFRDIIFEESLGLQLKLFEKETIATKNQQAKIEKLKENNKLIEDEDLVSVLPSELVIKRNVTTPSKISLYDHTRI